MDPLSTSRHPPRPAVSSLGEFYATIPLPPGSPSIRLLQLHAAEKSQPNSSLVGRVYLADLVSSPSFTALSYVRGEKGTSRRTITCQPQGFTFEITTGCYEALWQLRKKYGSLTIWVDAICINQEDDDEKTSQILLMREIYSLAECVYVWLGVGDEASDKAMDYLKRCAKMMARLPFEDVVAPKSIFGEGHHNGWMMHLARLRTLKDAFARLQLLLSGPLAGRGVSLDSVLSRNWIHRAWTFQEIILSTNPLILCGDKYLSWEDLINSLYFPRSQPGKYDIARLPNHIPLPVSVDVLHHWWSIIDLWLTFRRAPLRGVQSTTLEGAADREILSNRMKFQALDRANETARSIRSCVACLLVLGYFAASGYGFYVVANLIGPMVHSSTWAWWIVLNLVWFGVNLAFAKPLLVSFYHACCFVIYGVRQQWNGGLSPGRADHLLMSDKAAELNGIRVALRERSSSVPHDMVISMLSIVQAMGSVDLQLDYKLPVAETFKQFFIHLIKLHPQGLMTLCDAGCPESFNGSWSGPSWVPNWMVRVPGSWIWAEIATSSISNRRNDHGATSRRTPFPVYRVVGNALVVEGWKIGSVSFQGACIPAISSGTQRPRVLELCRWYDFFRRQNFQETTGSIYESHASAIFAVLEGISPVYRRAVYTKWYPAYGDWTGRLGYNVQIRHPPYKAPYDFTDRKDHFTDFVDLYSILEEAFPRLTGEEDHPLSRGELDEAALSPLEGRIARSTRAANYAQRIAESMTRDHRALFVAGGDSNHDSSSVRSWIGSGPPHMEVGDDIFIFTGIPVPMVLRSNTGDEGYRVVGAVLVHGLMHTGGRCLGRQSHHITLL
ncbi:heterokaryon incompatibility protein-domain-containing protein [Ilyonectria destructans]|nr:heterokaryon incompatibility protein-domain-containing protein [Ilyonectria destructans]